MRWLACEMGRTDSLERLAAFAIGEANTESWDEMMEIEIANEAMTIMDTVLFTPMMHLEYTSRCRLGRTSCNTTYAASMDAMAIIHRLEYLG